MDVFPGRFSDPGLFWLHDLFWLLIVIALVVGTFLVVRAVLDRPHAPHTGVIPWPAPTAALQELDLRYARGEIDRIEYLQRRTDLLGQPGPEPGAPSTPPPTTPAKR